MQINAKFDSPVCVHSDKLAWQASPMKGVDRRMLDRIGDEVARATSIVRYAKGSAFAEHTHSDGEEFVVLEGVFQDEHAIIQRALMSATRLARTTFPDLIRAALSS